MEKYSDLMQESMKQLHLADHMIKVTYPLLQDPKLIAPISERLYGSLLKAIQALVEYEYAYKRIEDIPSDEGKQVELFVEQCMRTHKLDKKILPLVKELKEFVDFRKQGTVEFSQHDQYVVCSVGYNKKTITLPTIKHYVEEIKQFVTTIHRIIEDNGL